jgi:hypothetical protein
MPLPALLIPIAIGGGSALAALFGAGKTIKAVKDTSEAKSVNADANKILKDEKERLEVSRKASNTALEALGAKKLYILDRSINQFVNIFGQLKNVDLQDSVGLEELSKFRLDKQSLDELRRMGGYAASIIGGVTSGALGGGLAAFGATSAVAAWGAASTGTAIGTLSGVAATNATLAFLGGGSLAAGGLGVAGGTAVLGGLVAGPALLIMGFVVGAKASKNLDNAYSNLAEAKKIAEELKAAAVLCNGIRRRGYMFERLLIRLDALFVPLIFGMESIIAERGVDWSAYQPEEKQTVAAAAAIAKAVKTVLDTPILTEDGKLTEESKQIAEEVKAIVDKEETKG